MKTVYTNKPMNKQENSSPSFKTLILMGCLVLCMIAVKVIYNPAEPAEEVEAMAEISGDTLPFETESDS